MRMMRYDGAMSRKPTRPRDDPEQSKRFIEMAEEVGAADGEGLDRVLKKVASDAASSRPIRIKDQPDRAKK